MERCEAGGVTFEIGLSSWVPHPYGSIPEKPPLRENAERFGVQGSVSPVFEAVRDVFAEKFARRRELGGACCAYVHGEKVVDLWGGIRNKESGEPRELDTMVVIHSATKGRVTQVLSVDCWLPHSSAVWKGGAFDFLSSLESIRCAISLGFFLTSAPTFEVF
ncbi:MAG TPA: serine hydrolase [Bryobacteraceae bacterium]|nr:serine hydrolase [Bryobacteraceae bacterium]